MSCTTPPTPDNLTPLLSTLPPELRLIIYHLALPFLHHRRSRLLADYISDSHWMAVSEPVFQDAAPLVFCSRLLYIYTHLHPPTTLVGKFDQLIVNAYPQDHDWVLPIVRGLVKRMALTVTFPQPALVGLAERLGGYVGRMDVFSGLRELHVSLGPEFMPLYLLWEEQLPSVFDCEKLKEDVQTSASEGVVPKMMEVVQELRRHVPRECRVVWKFDRAGMPQVTPMAKTAQCARQLAEFNEVMGWLWERVDNSAVRQDGLE